MFKTTTYEKQSLSSVLSLLALFASFVLYFAAKWFADTYGRIGFDALWYTMTSDLGGVSPTLIMDYVQKGLLPAIASASVTWLILFAVPKLKFLRRYHLAVWLSGLLSVCLLGHAAWNTELTEYVFDSLRSGTIYTNHYTDPDDTGITFPEETRNLIYIILESMETSYLSREQGGAMKENLIPELYTLAHENVNFSHNQDVGGFHCIDGTSWTIGAMVAQTAGIPLKTPTRSRNEYGLNGTPFLPGATSLMDILHEEGYYQALMVGSRGSLCGREPYYTQHGVDIVYDLTSTILSVPGRTRSFLLTTMSGGAWRICTCSNMPSRS